MSKRSNKQLTRLLLRAFVFVCAIFLLANLMIIFQKKKEEPKIIKASHEAKIGRPVTDIRLTRWDDTVFKIDPERTTKHNVNRGRYYYLERYKKPDEVTYATWGVDYDYVYDYTLYDFETDYYRDIYRLHYIPNDPEELNYIPGYVATDITGSGSGDGVLMPFDPNELIPIEEDEIFQKNQNLESTQ